ncbi:phosphohydrolase [Aquamicrobium zhengzhouense]|uniref:Phosphohydrolase n=1 Tax=Aquamicrobium zhengzhouense TaxID=2781738 RepID=A0ABS0SA50_9HYPH|nr:phosphohydrolase [Aquamicrobium zhengzhouense]MBI1620122.1 phosphohydrolase [Aquamicrobium zhengzhouense]
MNAIPTHHHRQGDWIQTFTGRQFWPLDPDAADIDIEDIAHALSMQCRFAGHCNRFYSVAEHSFYIARYLESQGAPVIVRLWGLLHDATEAYLVDLPRPIKISMPDYREAEGRLMRVIAQCFDLPTDTMPEAVKDADRRILSDEAAQNMCTPPAPWSGMREPLGITINCFPQTVAKNLFLSEFQRLEDLRHERS